MFNFNDSVINVVIISILSSFYRSCSEFTVYIHIFFKEISLYTYICIILRIIFIKIEIASTSSETFAVMRHLGHFHANLYVCAYRNNDPVTLFFAGRKKTHRTLHSHSCRDIISMPGHVPCLGQKGSCAGEFACARTYYASLYCLGTLHSIERQKKGWNYVLFELLLFFGWIIVDFDGMGNFL